MIHTATRTENTDGTFTYTVNGAVMQKASKTEYAAVTIWQWDGMDESDWYPKFHKTNAAALKASGYQGSHKLQTVHF